MVKCIVNIVKYSISHLQNVFKTLSIWGWIQSFDALPFSYALVYVFTHFQHLLQLILTLPLPHYHLFHRYLRLWCVFEMPKWKHWKDKLPATSVLLYCWELGDKGAFSNKILNSNMQVYILKQATLEKTQA